uniref:Uncharacterized protein n=1 Tax=Callorhinchus milii TaxID=7868 RepID=A0A4W3IK08_CALMI
MCVRVCVCVCAWVCVLGRGRWGGVGVSSVRPPPSGSYASCNEQSCRDFGIGRAGAWHWLSRAGAKLPTAVPGVWEQVRAGSAVTELLYFNFSLSQNELGEAGASEMGKVLSQMERLKKINLCRRRTASGSSVGGQLLAKGLSNCIKLEEINLDSLELGDSGVQLLAMGLLTMPHLKKLNLRSNSISSRGAAQLADCLRGSTEIEDIDLCDNYIEDLGANKLADVLPNMKHLKKLNLTRNNITAAGGSKVVEALGQCPSVQEIHLSSNKTGDQTATRLAQTLPKLPCMKILNLQSNDIGVDGGVQLARGLFVCTTIEEIRWVMAWHVLT